MESVEPTAQGVVLQPPALVRCEYCRVNCTPPGTPVGCQLRLVPRRWVAEAGAAHNRARHTTSAESSETSFFVMGGPLLEGEREGARGGVLLIDAASRERAAATGRASKLQGRAGQIELDRAE